MSSWSLAAEAETTSRLASSRSVRSPAAAASATARSRSAEAASVAVCQRAASACAQKGFVERLAWGWG